MSIQAVIDRLMKSPTPARTLDASIGELVGWIKQVDMKKDPKTGRPTRTVSWRPPTGITEVEPPFYTFDMQAAYQLIISIDPDAACAVTFDGRARADTGEDVQAGTPQIAMCVLALKRLQAVSSRK